MPRKNARPADRKLRARLKLATKNGHVQPSYFRQTHPHLAGNDMAMSLAYALSGMRALSKRDPEA